MIKSELYLSDLDWQQLSDRIADRPDVCRALGIQCNPWTGFPGWDELVEFLGGQLNIWPERFRMTFAAEIIRQDDEMLLALLHQK